MLNTNLSYQSFIAFINTYDASIPVFGHRTSHYIILRAILRVAVPVKANASNIM